MPEDIVRRVLRLTGYEVSRHVFDEAASALTLWVRQNPADRFHRCRRCGVSVRQVHDSKERRVRDLPWGEWKVWLVVTVHRARCRRCGVTVEGIDFLEGKQLYLAAGGRFFGQDESPATSSAWPSALSAGRWSRSSTSGSGASGFPTTK